MPWKGRPNFRDRLALAAGRGAAWLSRVTRRGSGGMIGGRVALRLQPKILEHLAADRLVALVTGTNGKTTTTRMLSEAVRAGGVAVASNRGGDNMTPGVVAALMSNPRAGVAILEIDEMHLELIAKATRPRVIVLLNLSRDQLDRVGEIAVIEKRIRRAVDENPQAYVVANVDDPLMTSAAWDSAHPVWVAAGKGWNGDSLTAPRTGGAIIYSPDESDATTGKPPELASGLDRDVSWRSIPVEELLAHEVPWDKPPTQSEFARPHPKWIWKAESYQPGVPVQLIDTGSGQETTATIQLPGRANRGNALQAFVAARLLGVEVSAAATGIAQVKDVAGRYASFSVDGRHVRMLLAKNPAGWMESLTMLNPQAEIIVGVNGQIPDGTDLSWLWDVNFESLSGKTVVATGERGADLQVRLNYADIETRWASTVLDAIEMVAPGEVDLLLNYTSFRDARAEFVARGWLQ
ncbi:MurT ligase domain-containing protein [Mobiluncus curtisii]|uniref:MurT ligase domain-containing protein n=1 Tax=Mobiluncus curtisii TaxID=2051 RepID=UPI00201625CB|nr:MurT ligase domain-containing protein [Mobiluncus curtisii]